MFVFFLGGAIVVIGAETLGKNYTFSHCSKGLVINGIYSKIRHPMDYGGILLSFGFALYLMSIFGMILAIVVVTPLQLWSRRG